MVYHFLLEGITMKLSRGFKNFLGFVFALSALYGITSKPDFFEIIVAVGCVVIAVLLFKPTEAEKAAKAEKAANAARVGNKANTPSCPAAKLRLVYTPFRFYARR